jgi:hypothetical protein
MEKIDKRVWTPDETCLPFFLSNSITSQPAALQRLFQFRVPDNCIAVITNLNLSSGSAANKPDDCLIFTRTIMEFININDEQSIPVYGALLDVGEFDQNGLNNHAVASSIFGSDIPCRIILEDGYWQLNRKAIGFGPMLIYISGFIFPRHYE